MLEELQKLVRHMEWADALVWRALPTRGEVQTDGHIHRLLYHTHLVQRVYVQIWRGEPPDMPDASTFEGLPALRSWGREGHRQVAEYVGALDARALEREIVFPWAKEMTERWGSACPATLTETLLQISAHSTYHRGQINRRLRELGGEPPLSDFIAWVWMGKPAPDWDGA